MQQVKPFSLVDLERDIAEEARNRPTHPVLARERQPLDYAPPAVRNRIPDYVEHRPGVEEIGKLTAEVVIQEYETAAKEVEAMGTELTERLKKLDATKAETLAAIDHVKQTAAKYREEGKRIFNQIEDCSLLTAEVRATCNALAGKIAAPSAAA